MPLFIRKPAGYPPELIKALSKADFMSPAGGDFYELLPSSITERRLSIMGVELYTDLENGTIRNRKELDFIGRFVGNHIANIRVMGRSLYVLEQCTHEGIRRVMDPFAGIGGTVISSLWEGVSEISGIEVYPHVFGELVSTVVAFLDESSIDHKRYDENGRRGVERSVKFRTRRPDTVISLYNGSAFEVLDIVYKGEKIVSGPPWPSSTYPAVLPDGSQTTDNNQEMFKAIGSHLSGFKTEHVMVRPHGHEIPLGRKVGDFLTEEAGYQISVYDSR